MVWLRLADHSEENERVGALKIAKRAQPAVQQQQQIQPENGDPPLAARAQQGSTLRRIGFLLPGGARTTVVRAQLEAFRQGMKEYGWIDGQNISIEYRFAEGKEDALPRLAADLVAANEGGGAVRDLEITATVFAHVHRRD